MKIYSGETTVLETLKQIMPPGGTLRWASDDISLFGLEAIKSCLPTNFSGKMTCFAVALPSGFLGGSEDRSLRNRLSQKALSKEIVAWLESEFEIRESPAPLPQALAVVFDPSGHPVLAFTGGCQLNSAGLGLAPSQGFNFLQVSENSEEASAFAGLFDQQFWGQLPPSPSSQLFTNLKNLASDQSGQTIFFKTLHHLFAGKGDDIDEDEILKSATGIRDTVVWKKLFRFQRDGAIGAINKLERHQGCIIADSVGLGKTFEALAVIKYYELRNDRVVVLCPKRLRDNWMVYRSNDRRNILSSDRFNYDILNHTDLTRTRGNSGDLDLANINWGNYDLIVIDESHNFRNKPAKAKGQTRYGWLMEKMIQAGVKSKVLMLSATPVNNRLADLRNQIYFATEGRNNALVDEGISNIEATIRLAQRQFNLWLQAPMEDRTPVRLMEMLGFDYFRLLDLLTIARSRKHIEKYYGTSETGRFPVRLPPRNIRADVDRDGKFSSIKDINDEIRRLNLSVYAPLRYVLPGKIEKYEEKYGTVLKGQDEDKPDRRFLQADREESLVHLLRVNMLKRMESAISSFVLTLGSLLQHVQGMIDKIDAQVSEVEEISIEDIDPNDPAFESLLIGKKVKVLLQDADLKRWKQDLSEDRDRLSNLLDAGKVIDSARDAKLAALLSLISEKIEKPLNAGNRKILIFTAFSDTAEYLYQQIAGWALPEHGLHCALVSGSTANLHTLPKLRKDLASILTAFSPRSKERPEEFSAEGEIDILIATDCISEGQNLQDCDMVVNYDIHWNPVRIIQRFGRIDRIGSPNEQIQLVNFWPNIELDDYINLEQRVSGRMVLLDISATGEENLIEQQSGNQMNDLEYRREQLVKLQTEVVDFEDLSNGLSISDLSLSDFRVALASFSKENPDFLPNLPNGLFAVVHTSEFPPGVIFCLEATGEAALRGVEPGYPLAPYYLLHVSDEGEVLLSYLQARKILEHLQHACSNGQSPDPSAYSAFDARTKNGRDMVHYQNLLSKAVSAITGRVEERSQESLFRSGGTHALPGEFAGADDFEVVSYLITFPEEQNV